MSIDLPPERDLTLIFERDDVKDALGLHCASQHAAEAVDTCPYCLPLLVLLADAISEWKAICELHEAGDKAHRTAHDA